MSDYIESIEEALAAGRAVAIPLTKGMVAYVDAEDYERVVAAGPWCALDNGRRSHPDAVAARDGRLARMHRLVLGVAPGEWVDHINGDRFDNRKANLRPATPKENAANRGPIRSTKTGYKGVGVRPNGRYKVEVCLRGKTDPEYVGDYDDLEAAARARDAFVREHKDPETERFNFPNIGERGLDGQIRTA